MKTKRLKMPKIIPVALDHRLLKRIEELAERMGEAKSTVMRIAMRVGLDQLEKLFASTEPPNLSNLISALAAAGGRQAAKAPAAAKAKKTGT